LAPQLKRKAVNRPNAEANLLGNLHDACSLPKLGTGAFKGGRVIEWPAKCFAVRNGSLKASMDPLPDHAALKLGKGANDLKHQLAGWRCGVNELPGCKEMQFPNLRIMCKDGTMAGLMPRELK
jgi:hypothetical protein